ncbi:MAG TPA: hypothetical protein VH257_09705, partial [Chloroflexota bacterium]|nr:hypothetical protein [Chloroflexota bacterium]
MSETPPDVRLRLRGNDLLIQFQEADEGAGPPEGGLRARVEEATGRPALVYDRRLGAYRTLALAYRAVREQLED